MRLTAFSIIAVAALAFGATPVLSEDTNVYDQFECPAGGAGGSGGGVVCICGCGTYANGSFWDCSPNGCDDKDGKTCTPSTRPASSRKTTDKEKIIIARLFPKASQKSMRTCVVTR